VSVPGTSAVPPVMSVPHQCSATPHACSATPCGWRMRPVQPPPVIARALSYLPDYNYDRIFCEEDTRPFVMGLSVALISVAFGLFTRRRAET
jgi:hypothetical protein